MKRLAVSELLKQLQASGSGLSQHHTSSGCCAGRQVLAAVRQWSHVLHLVRACALQYASSLLCSSGRMCKSRIGLSRLHTPQQAKTHTTS